MNLTSANKLDNRPSMKDVAKAFKSAKVVAYVGATVLTVILIFIWPGLMSVVGVMDLFQFKQWVSEPDEKLEEKLEEKLGEELE